MKSLITGGAGFIGSHLSEILVSRNHEVVIVDNFSTGKIENLKNIKNQVKIIECDISIEFPESALDDIRHVYHLAALADIVPSITQPKNYLETNINGTLNLMEAVRSSRVEKVVYAASSSCYGIPKTFPTPEEYEIDPKYPYALSKYLGEQVFLHWVKLYGIKGVSLRLFNVFGPRARTSGNYGAVMGVFLAQKLANKAFTIVGDGNQLRDFIYVKDVAEAFIKAANSKYTNEIFNIGTGNPVSINTIAEFIGGNGYVHVPKRPGEPDTTHADISKAKKLLNWKPEISLKDGIKSVLNNISEWQTAPLWDEKSIEIQTSDWFKYLGNNEV
jgi:UDP-glucose 4-epimerase